MIRALAQVTRVLSINAPGQGHKQYQLTLSCEQQTSCNSCASKSSCASGQVTQAIGNKQHQWSLVTEQPASVGDVVEIGLPEKAFVSAAALVYLAPLLALFAGALIGDLMSATWFGGQEWPSILGGVIAAGASVALIRRRLQRYNLKAEQQVTLIRNLGQSLDLNSHSL